MVAFIAVEVMKGAVSVGVDVVYVVAAIIDLGNLGEVVVSGTEDTGVSPSKGAKRNFKAS